MTQQHVIQFEPNGKISKLLRLLSSPEDGEVVAAARAIGRTLEAGGKSWHDIIIAMCPAKHGDDPQADWRQAVVECLLSPKERDFLANIRRQYNITSKQTPWLIDIVGRVRHG